MAETGGKRCKGRFPVGPSCRAVCDYKTGRWVTDSCQQHKPGKTEQFPLIDAEKRNYHLQ